MSGGASPEFEAKLAAVAKDLHDRGAIIPRPKDSGKPFAPYIEPERDPVDNADQPPEVDIHDDTKKLPPTDAAARRVIDFVSWFGDGEITPDVGLGSPPLYARDLAALARVVLGADL